MKMFISNKLIPFAFYFMMLMPILGYFMASLSVFILGFSVLIYYLNQKDKSIHWNYLLYSIPFWIISISILWSDNQTQGWKIITTIVSFLVFPLIMSIFKYSLNTTIFSHMMEIFLASCCVLCLFYLGYFIYHNSFNALFQSTYLISLFRQQVYHIPVLNVHPTYLCAWLNFGIIYMLSHWKSTKLHYLIYLFVFGIIILLMMSKITIACLGFGVLFFIVQNNKLTKKNKWIFLGLFLVFGIISYQIPMVKNRITEYILYKDTLPKGLEITPSNSRNAITLCNQEIAKEYWLTGVGIGDYQDYLDNCYRSKQFDFFLKEQKYGTHNFYYTLLLSCGIGGLFLFILYLGIILWKSYQSKDYLMQFLIFQTIVICITEEYLLRQHGLMFFCLFFMILYQKNISRIAS